jgi:hypothetical protein
MIDTALELPQETAPLAETSELTRASVWLPYLALVVTVGLFAMNGPAKLAAIRRAQAQELAAITEDYPARSFTAPVRTNWIGRPAIPWLRFSPR